MPSHFYHGLFGIYILLSLLPTAPPTRKKQKQSFTKFFVPFCLINLSPKKNWSKTKIEKNFKHVSSYNFLKHWKKPFFVRKAVLYRKKIWKKSTRGKMCERFSHGQKKGVPGSHVAVESGIWELIFFRVQFFGVLLFRNLFNITLTPNAHGQYVHSSIHF